MKLLSTQYLIAFAALFFLALSSVEAVKGLRSSSGNNDLIPSVDRQLFVKTTGDGDGDGGTIEGASDGDGEGDGECEGKGCSKSEKGEGTGKSGKRGR